ncbi:MAG: hypothetical protein KKB37_11145 [Alphaproteobacteria bacterium]|nr:hypothetical protein [Alphaproteobacteria bacterium]
MKSFGATASADASFEDFGRYPSPVTDPEALFSDLQWYIYRARNTVYFTSFSNKRYDKEALKDMVAKMCILAPQLTFGYEGARPGAPLTEKQLEAITKVELIDSFDGYPDKCLSRAQELFEHKGMPLFRVTALVRRDGPDEQGRASIILVRSAHAMLEGADSALLTRSQRTGFSPGETAHDQAPVLQKFLTGALIGLAAILHLVIANLLAPKKLNMGFATLAIERSRLRRIADKFGVRQRSLMFAVVMYALNQAKGGFNAKKISAAYTGLDDDRAKKGDSYFRVRTLRTQFPFSPDFATFARAVDAKIDEIESRDSSKEQLAMNLVMKTHRFLAHIMPFMYTDRFFRYSGSMNIVLTLVPPHRVAGNLTAGMTEPIYCGSYHPSANLIAFVPGREYVTFNFSMHQEHIANVPDVEALLDTLDAA